MLSLALRYIKKRAEIAGSCGPISYLVDIDMYIKILRQFYSQHKVLQRAGSLDKKYPTDGGLNTAGA